MLQPIYDALRDAPLVLRGLFYFLLTVCVVAVAPLALLAKSIVWLGRANRTPTVLELSFAAYLTAFTFLLWGGAVYVLASSHVEIVATECPDDVVRAAIERACEVPQ